MFTPNTTGGWPFSPALFRILRRIRHNRRNGGCAIGCDRDRTDDSRLPWSTDGAYGGWGGRAFHGVDAPAKAPGAEGEPTPIVFVHGLQRDACDWQAHAEFFLERGYGGDDLWAITFREGASTHPEMADQLDDFVGRVREHTGSDTVAVVGHSLGVTGTRFWLAARGRYEWVETVVGLAGPNHGTVFNTWCVEAGLDGEDYRVSPFLRADYDEYEDHPLAWLNRVETPGDVEYYTVRGADDALYWRCPESPELEGATNVVLETGHDGVRTARATKEYLFEWLTGEHPYDLRHQVGLAR
jgi:triacylglycerol esterase/lipase EstA (alpha/beta hydrolase family)